jgi:transcriptional regulator with XRE-family HTH domain
MKHPLQTFRETQTPPWSQTRLAEALGVQRVTVWRWERGDRFPERELWPKIRALTGLGIDDLGRAA